MDAGKHLFIGIHGTSLDQQTRDLLRQVRPAGIILFDRNLDTPEQTRSFTRQLRDICEKPNLFIGIDQEGGRVSRLSKLGLTTPHAADFQQCGDTRLSRHYGHLTGNALALLGINLNFAPVLDIQHLGGPLGKRCWGTNPSEVVSNASAFLEGMQETGVFGVGKHFPGLGRATLDTHEELPAILGEAADLLMDMQPFERLIQNSNPSSELHAVMVSHAYYRNVQEANSEPIPASLSSELIQGILREKLRFKGIVMTDDLEMGAIAKHFTFTKAVEFSLKAGADWLLVCHDQAKILQAWETISFMENSESDVRKGTVATLDGSVLPKFGNFPEFNPSAFAEIQAQMQELTFRMSKNINIPKVKD